MEKTVNTFVYKTNKSVNIALLRDVNRFVNM